MKIFVYEYICGGGLAGQPLPESLLTEGRAMWSAVTEDFARIAGAEVTTTLDARFDWRAPAGNVRLVRVEPGAEADTVARLAGEADFTLPIAPEFQGILERLCRAAVAAGGKLLGPAADAVAAATDKFKLSTTLRARRVRTPESLIARPRTPAGDRGIRYPAVLKPRDGAGSQATVLIKTKADLATALELPDVRDWPGPLIIQPLIVGRAASVSLLVGPKEVRWLPPGVQELSADGRFRYLGGRMPLAPHLVQRAARLAMDAVEAVPGLAGYVGVDMVLGNGSARDAVIEINPRLTTSYVGLRALSETNLAEQMIRIVRGEPVDLKWKKARVKFSPDGRVQVTEAAP